MRNASGRLERMRATLRREAAVLNEVADMLSEDTVLAVDLLLRNQTHVIVAGAGTSNAVAQRFAHLLSCSGLPAVWMSAADCRHGSSGAVRAEDTVVLISKGGKTGEVNEFAAICKARGARIVALTENPASPLGQMADGIIPIRIPAHSDPFGMVATSSSLANAAVCDAICETVLQETGYGLEDFAATHPGGAVGERIRSREASQ